MLVCVGLIYSQGPSYAFGPNLHTPIPASMSNVMFYALFLYKKCLPLGDTIKMSTRIPSFLYTLYLMTYSDIKSILLPQTIFGISNALAAPVFGLDSRSIPQPASILWRLPLTALWVWINLLLFTIENQRQTSSIEEDKLNKPWRPIPAGRITQSQMESWRGWVYCAAFAVSYWIGGLVQCVALMGLGMLSDYPHFLVLPGGNVT